MGSVWRAEDTTLDRAAAVKILPDAFAEDPQFLARFEREAKLLAGLSHPNLAAVYGVHHAGTTRFLAMELVPGEDLSGRLERGPLRIDEAVRVMEQVADALEAAHDHGVIHRDLKPANVRLLPDGRVKVLDFGLAKTVASGVSHENSASGDAVAPLTVAGAVLGTPPYMSPEQARGQPLDVRTDIWSFGCVLWECLTGRTPFPAATLPDQLAAILNDEPDWTTLPARTPPSVERLLQRCLSKDLRGRLHHIADARLDLEERVAGTTEPAAPPTSASRRGILPAFALGVIAVLAIVFFGPWARESSAFGKPLLADAHFIRITNHPGEELGAAISPDGDYVAFLSDERGPFEVYVGRIGTGVYRNVTSENPDALASAPKARVRRVGFLGDGSGLWLGGGEDQKIRTVSLVGNRIQTWLDEGMIHVDWSPRDGDARFVYSQSRGGDPVFVADDELGVLPSEPILESFDGYHQHFPTWSPNAEWIYLVRGRVMIDDMDLWRMRPDGSDLEQLTEDLRNVTYPTPISEDTVLFIASEPNGAGPWLWELDVASGAPPRRATIGLDRYTSIAASRDGRTLVATVARPEAALWTIPIKKEADGPATEEDVKRHPLPVVRALAPRIRGDRLFYLSSRGGGDGLWRHDDDKSTEVWDGGAGALLEPAAVSLDGTRLAIIVRDPRRRLFVMDADGSKRKPLMADVEVVGSACWSHDGEWVAVGGSRDGETGLFRVRVRDGTVILVAEGEAMNPVWSPDGRMIVFAGPHVGFSTALVAVTPDGDPIKEFPEILVRPFGERFRFLPNGSGLVYVQGVNPEQEFHLLDLESWQSRQLTELEDSATLRTFDVTEDGSTIVFDRQSDNGDIVLIERDGNE
jgi:Tol biopolymer transport system component